MGDAYLADDYDSRLRKKAPKCCQLCLHFKTGFSIVDDSPYMACSRINETTEAEAVTNRLLYRFAKLTNICEKGENFKN